MGCHDK